MKTTLQTSANRIIQLVQYTVREISSDTVVKVTIETCTAQSIMRWAPEFSDNPLLGELQRTLVTIATDVRGGDEPKNCIEAAKALGVRPDHFRKVYRGEVKPTRRFLRKVRAKLEELGLIAEVMNGTTK